MPHGAVPGGQFQVAVPPNERGPLHIAPAAPPRGTRRGRGLRPGNPYGMFGNPGAALAAAGGPRPREAEGGGLPRAPSAYNIFMREEVARIKQTRTDLAHKEVFKEAARNWATAPENPAYQRQQAEAGEGGAGSGAGIPAAIVDGEDPAAVAPEGEGEAAEGGGDGEEAFGGGGGEGGDDGAADEPPADAVPPAAAVVAPPAEGAAAEEAAAADGGGEEAAPPAGDAAPVHYPYADGPTAEEPASKERRSASGGGGRGCRRRGAGFRRCRFITSRRNDPAAAPPATPAASAAFR